MKRTKKHLIVSLAVFSLPLLAERHLIPDSVPKQLVSTPTSPLTEGTVSLNAILDEVGSVKDIKLNSGDEKLASVAIAHLRKCRFAPASPDGDKNPTLTITYQFKPDSKAQSGVQIGVKAETNTIVISFDPSPPPAPGRLGSTVN